MCTNNSTFLIIFTSQGIVISHLLLFLDKSRLKLGFSFGFTCIRRNQLQKISHCLIRTCSSLKWKVKFDMHRTVIKTYLVIGCLVIINLRHKYLQVDFRQVLLLSRIGQRCNITPPLLVKMLFQTKAIKTIKIQNLRLFLFKKIENQVIYFIWN